MKFATDALASAGRFFQWTTLPFWLALVCWSLAVWLFACFLVVDASFIRPLAPDSIDEDTFQHVAWGYRFFAVICTMMAVYLFKTERWGWGTVTGILGLVCAVILFGHALGLSFKSMEEQYSAGAVVRQVEGISVEEINARIADIDLRAAQVREDRTAKVDRLQASIHSILNDGLNNDHLADVYRADQTKAEDEAAATLKALDEERAGLVKARSDARSGAAETASVTRTFDPFFLGLGRVRTGQWAPGEPVDETVSYTSGLGFFAIFFAFGELLMMLTPGKGMTFMLLHLERRKDWVKHVYRSSDDLPPGHTRWEGSDEEWSEIEAALKAHRNIKAGAKKGARTRRVGNKIEAEDKYYRDRISMFMDEHNRGLSTAEIAKAHGMSVSLMRTSYAPHMTPEEQAALFPIAEPAPDPEESHAEEEPQQPEIEPEAEAPEPEEVAGEDAPEEPPKEYPIGFHDPDVKPNGAAHDDKV